VGSASLSCFLTAERCVRLSLPYSGSFGPQFPTYWCGRRMLCSQQARTQLAVLRSARTAHRPSWDPSLVARHPVPCSSSFICVPSSRLAGQAGVFLPFARALVFVSTPRLLTTAKEPADCSQSDALPGSRTTPVDACPVLRPRWCPSHSPYRALDCCLPVAAHRRLSLHFREGLSFDHDYTHFEVQ